MEKYNRYHTLWLFDFQISHSEFPRTKDFDMTKKVSFKVGMTCGGCKGAVTRILSKIEGKDYNTMCLSLILFNKNICVLLVCDILRRY